MCAVCIYSMYYSVTFSSGGNHADSVVWTHPETFSTAQLSNWMTRKKYN